MNTPHSSVPKHHRKPPPVSRGPQDDARSEWLYSATEELLRGCSVSFQRRMRPQQGIPVSASTELAVVPPQETALVVYSTEKGLEPWLQVIRSKIDGFTPDISTRKPSSVPRLNERPPPAGSRS